MKSVILLIILVSAVLFGTAYADSSSTTMKGSGIALLNSGSPQMYESSIRILLSNHAIIDSGLVTISTDQSTAVERMTTNQWSFSYGTDGSFHASGPVIAGDNTSYNMVLDGNRLLASTAGSLWKISGELKSNGQNYILEYLVNSKDHPNDNVTSYLTANVTIPNGNSVQASTGFFLPLNLEILQGTTVTWKNQDNIGHTVQSINSQGTAISVFNSPVLKTGDMFTYKFDKPGVYHYYCSIHPWRIGVVTVS